MKRSIKHFLDDALEYCEKAHGFVENMTFEEFDKDEKTFLAVTRALEIIGEALKNVPEEFKNKYLGIPWKEIIGFRNTVHMHILELIRKLFGTVQKKIQNI